MANCDVRNMRREPWLEEEDERLTTIVGTLGEKHWDVLAKQSGLRRSGKSCRLRWLNYLRPNLKHGEITHEEEHTILSLHKQWGNKWSKIAKRLPGRTDNEIKNYWRSHLKKKSEAQQECCDYMVGESSMSIEKEDIFGRSSSETFEACNMNALGNDSPYESRMLDWISSCCWSGDDAVKHDEDCMGTCPCFCLLGSRFEEEEKKQCVWDLWNPIWEMG